MVATAPDAHTRRDKPVTHYKLNRIILGVAALYTVVIVAAAVFGPTSSSDEPELAEYTPGYVDSSETPTPHDGMGGVSGDDVSIAGTILDAETGEPLAGVSVSAVDDEGDDVITTTGADGRFELTDISETVAVTFSLEGYAAIEQELEPDDSHVIEMEQPVIQGRVINAEGSPIRGATISVGDVYTRSIENGVFRLENIPAEGDIIIKAAGYETKTLPPDEFDGGFVLEHESVQALYAPASLVADEDSLAELIEMIQETDANALVIEVKDQRGRVHFDSELEQAQEIGASEGTLDLQRVVDELHVRGIQAIARMAVFEDPTLAEAHPELGIRDSFSDDLWRTWQGRAWANPYREEVWDYNIALIQEVAAYGFDEIELTSVQFPESGLVNRAEFGQVSTASHRQAAVGDFLDEAYSALAATPTRLAAEIFAMSLWEQSNRLTGQDLHTMVERVDYLTPRLFPSHFPSGSLGFENPESEPFAMVGRSLESGHELLPRHLAIRIGPWLQAFSYGSSMPFDDSDVREQIEATSRFNSSGWMLWNPDGEYDPDGLINEE
jgi:hypothetical protein